MKTLHEMITSKGEKFRKKHGEWYRLHIYDDNYLILDTWNGQINHHKGCKPSDTNNMYRVVYIFSGDLGAVNEQMRNFWHKHAQLIPNI